MSMNLKNRARRARCTATGVRPIGRLLAVVVALAGLLVWSTPGFAARPPGKGRGKSTAKRPADAKKYDGGLRAIGVQSSKRQKKTLSDEELNAIGPRPVLQADEPIHEFGEVWVGPVLKHTFKITNAGDMLLKITKVKPSCGCTIAGTYPRTLKPGESGEFPFSVASTKLRGKFSKSITVSSNDPATPSLRLQLRGVVKRYIEMSPRAIQLGKLYGKESKERVVKLTNNTEKPLKLTVQTRPNGNYDITLTETSPGQEFELHVTAKIPFSDTGVFRKKIILGTNLEEQETISIDMRGTVPPRIDVKPSAITMRQSKVGQSQGKPTTRVVRMTNYGITPVKVLEATVDDPAVTVTLKEQKVGEAYNIKVRFPAG